MYLVNAVYRLAGQKCSLEATLTFLLSVVGTGGQVQLGVVDRCRVARQDDAACRVAHSGSDARRSAGDEKRARQKGGHLIKRS
jgi:hypothetical protein